MSALTPARGCACGLLNLAHIPCSLPRRSLHFTCLTFRALRLQPPHRLPRSLCHLSCQRRRLPVHHGSGLRHSIGGSPVGTAESSSCHYGLPVRLALLPTPPRDDAVTVGYRTETGIPEGDLHLSDVARLWTHDGRDSLAMTMGWSASSDSQPFRRLVSVHHRLIRQHPQLAADRIGRGRHELGQHDHRHVLDRIDPERGARPHRPTRTRRACQGSAPSPGRA